MEYPYSQVNGFSKRQKYEYTSYHGMPFLEAYRESRRKFIDKLLPLVEMDGKGDMPTSEKDLVSVWKQIYESHSQELHAVQDRCEGEN